MGLVSFLMGAWCNWKMTLGVSLNSHLCSSQILGLVPDQEQPMKLQSGIFGNKKQHFNCAAQSIVMSCKPKNNFICTITRFRHFCKPKDSGEQDYINTPCVPVYLCKSCAQAPPTRKGSGDIRLILSAVSSWWSSQEFLVFPTTDCVFCNVVGSWKIVPRKQSTLMKPEGFDRTSPAYVATPISLCVSWAASAEPLPGNLALEPRLLF